MSGLKIDERRILSKIEYEDECWSWKGAMHNAGYGMMKVRGAMRLAHRVAYETFVGPIPDGLTIDHLCRNRACVNPSHLEPVTRGENVLRGAGGPAVNSRKTHCKRGHPLSGDNLIVAKDTGYRKCRICENAAQTRKRARLTPEQQDRRRIQAREAMRRHRAKKKAAEKGA